MTINEIQDNIISEFEIFDDWMDRYQYLIDLSKNLKLIDDKYKTENYLIKGCQSKVWINAEMTDNKIYFSADSDALITKGIVTLVISVFSGQSPEDILKAELYFIDKIGLKENLSPTRANGLLAMIKQIKLYAMAFNQKNKK